MDGTPTFSHDGSGDLSLNWEVNKSRRHEVDINQSRRIVRIASLPTRGHGFKGRQITEIRKVWVRLTPSWFDEISP